MKINKQRNKRRDDLNKQIIKRKEFEIESLKEKISKLELDNNAKDELINSIDCLRDELKAITENLKKKSEEYDKLNSDLRQMKKVFNQEVFKGKWRIIRWLMR